MDIVKTQLYRNDLPFVYEVYYAGLYLEEHGWDKEVKKQKKKVRDKEESWDNELSCSGLSLCSPVLSPVQCVLHLVHWVGRPLSWKHF